MYREVKAGVTRLTGKTPPVIPGPIAAWPVGAVFIGYTSTSPATLLGGGTWVQIAQGQMLVGQKASDSDFDTLGKTGGEKTHVLTNAEMPSHLHTAANLTVGNLQINTSSASGSNANRVARGTGTGDGAINPGISGPVNGTTDIAGSDAAHNNMPPFLTVYIWRRTA